MTPSPARLTLGAVPPGGLYCSIGETPYWLPCLTRSEVEPGEPHVYFITKGVEATVFCPSCRPARVARATIDTGHSRVETAAGATPAPRRASADTSSLAPAHLSPSQAPWGDARPVWECLAQTDPRRAARVREDYEERAAIMEYVGGMPRAQAEWAAYRCVLLNHGFEPPNAQLEIGAAA
jgi:hypothetical protein